MKKNNMNYRFYKEQDNRWYIDLPEWEGSKEDLEMVLGADLLLFNLANDNDEVYVKFDISPFNDCHTLTHEGDGYYDNDAWHGPSLIWLCYVTTFVFGNYPDRIFYAKI